MQQNSPPLRPRRIPAELLRNARVLSNREEILPLLPKRKVFVEIGVALGDFSELILRECDVEKFVAIDLFVLHNAKKMWGGRVQEVLQGQNHEDFYRQRFEQHVSDGRMEIIKGDSIDALQKIPDQGADIFYVDANHSYDAVKSELSIIKKKITPSGWIILNDYTMVDWLTGEQYGVIQATNEFMIDEKWEMIYFALHNGMFCDVALRKVQEI